MSDVSVTTRDGATIATFDPAQLSIITFPKTGRKVWPSRASEALAADPSAVAVIDGPMFNNCDPPNYATSSCADMDYLHVDSARGLNYAADSDKSQRGITLSVMPDGSTRWALGANMQSGAKTSVQMYPSLVFNREIQSVSDRGSNANRVWRAGIAQLSDGKLAFVVAQDTLPDFGRRVKALGAVHAGYTDGGGSTALLSRQQRVGSSEDRPVATWLAVRAKNAPAPPSSPLDRPERHGGQRRPPSQSQPQPQPQPQPQTSLALPTASLTTAVNSKTFPIVMGALLIGTTAFVAYRFSRE